MLKIDPFWGETAETFLNRAFNEDDRHFRMRLFALYFIASGESGVAFARKTGKSRITISQWVHNFNRFGIDGIRSNWKGNPGRILNDEQLQKLKEAVLRHPRESGIKKGRWTGKTVVAWVRKHYRETISVETARKYLHLLGFRHKKPRKRFTKADPEKQRRFAEDLEKLEKERSPDGVTVYVDEGTIQQDALPRKGWFLKGEPAEVDSHSPGKNKILFYAAVVRPLGKVITMQTPWFNSENTAVFLNKIRNELPENRIDLVWDGAPWHGGSAVHKALSNNDILEHKLPVASPKMNACEFFIRWAKETLSYNLCWKDLQSLKLSFRGFVATLARQPGKVLQRCRPEMLGFNVA